MVRGMDHHNLICAVSADETSEQPRSVLALGWAGQHELHPLLPLNAGMADARHPCTVQPFMFEAAHELGPRVGDGALQVG